MSQLIRVYACAREMWTFSGTCVTDIRPFRVSSAMMLRSRSYISAMALSAALGSPDDRGRAFPELSAPRFDGEQNETVSWPRLLDLQQQYSVAEEDGSSVYAPGERLAAKDDIAAEYEETLRELLGD